MQEVLCMHAVYIRIVLFLQQFTYTIAIFLSKFDTHSFTSGTLESNNGQAMIMINKNMSIDIVNNTSINATLLMINNKHDIGLNISSINLINKTNAEVGLPTNGNETFGKL
jgi:hypothetical protein